MCEPVFIIPISIQRRARRAKSFSSAPASFAPLHSFSDYSSITEKRSDARTNILPPPIFSFSSISSFSFRSSDTPSSSLRHVVRITDAWCVFGWYHCGKRVEVQWRRRLNASDYYYHRQSRIYYNTYKPMPRALPIVTRQ